MNWIEQYDQDSGYTFEIPELALSENPTPEMHAALLSALYNGIRLGCKQVPVFAVSGSDSVVTLQREDYRASLEQELEYFLQLEEYEICQTLSDLQREL